MQATADNVSLSKWIKEINKFYLKDKIQFKYKDDNKQMTKEFNKSFLYWNKREKIPRWMETANFLDYTLFTSGETQLLRKPSPIRFFLTAKTEPDDFWTAKTEPDDLDTSRNNINNGDKA